MVPLLGVRLLPFSISGEVELYTRLHRLKKRFMELKEVEARMNEFKGAVACAQVLRTMTAVIKSNKLCNSHGLTEREVAEFFPRVCHFALKTYGNRMRDLYKLGLAGKHSVHGERNYYPIGLDEQGLIDHSKCEECQK